MATKIADLLDELDFFKRFAYRDLETLGGFLVTQHAKKGDVIFNEGDPGSHMLILTEGKMVISKGGEDGGPHLLSYEGKGRIIGEMALLDQERRSATCVADEDCTLLLMWQADLAKLAVEHPALAYNFMFALAQLLSKRLRRTSGVLAEFLVS